MLIKKPRHEPVNLASLSPSSIYHLRAACVRIIEDETCILENGVKVIAERQKANSNTKFTFFLDLPLEIQAKIWRLFMEEEPRIVQLGSFMNEPNKLRQLNRQIKEDCLTLHGFIDTDQLKRRKEQNNNTIFHPEFDLLHLGPNSPWIFGPRSCIRRFAACGALDKIRCVAIMCPRSDLSVGIQFESLRQYQNLEVVFIVTSTRTRSSAFGWKEKEWLRFREVDDERAATLIQDGRWFPPTPLKKFTQERRAQWQGMMARGPRRIAPRVVFVEEIRAWHEGILHQPSL